MHFNHNKFNKIINLFILTNSYMNWMQPNTSKQSFQLIFSFTVNRIHLLWFKEIVHSKMKMYSPSGHPTCRWVSSKQIWRNWALLVDYCDVFISCLNSHSDGTHSLQRTHSLDVWMKKLIYGTSWMAWGLVRFQQMFILGEVLQHLTELYMNFQ